LKKALLVILAAGLMLSSAGSLRAESDPDSSKVTWLRWMDPYRDPITCREYRESRQFAERLDPRLVYEGNKEDTPICIVMNNYLHFTLESSCSVFISDLESEGYAPNVYTAYNDGDEVGLKDILISEWNSRGIAGAILIGDLPVAWYEMTHPPEYGGNHVEFPIDLFFMDLDGRWLDREPNGLYDGHDDGSGDVEADIWVGRLLAINLTDHGASEVAMMSNYLDKNHRYRTGELRLQDKALAYVDNDYAHTDTSRRWLWPIRSPIWLRIRMRPPGRTICRGSDRARTINTRTCCSAPIPPPGHTTFTGERSHMITRCFTIMRLKR